MNHTKADRIFANYIKDRDGWKCQKCGKKYDKNNPAHHELLQCSHLWSRGKLNTRFDPINCDSLCAIPCHQHFEHNREKYHQWKINKIGQTAFDDLRLRSNQLVFIPDDMKTVYKVISSFPN
jgi:ssDNA-binding Zn-finger/Zn-ribbon topoisomerase 1